MLSQFRPYEGVPGVPDRMQCMISLIELRIPCWTPFTLSWPGGSAPRTAIFGAAGDALNPSKLLRPLEVSKTKQLSRRKSIISTAMASNWKTGYDMAIVCGDWGRPFSIVIALVVLGLLPFLDTSMSLDFLMCLGYVGFDTYNSWLTCGNGSIPI